jgi:hypothetical protein
LYEIIQETAMQLLHDGKGIFLRVINRFQIIGIRINKGGKTIPTDETYMLVSFLNGRNLERSHRKGIRQFAGLPFQSTIRTEAV